MENGVLIKDWNITETETIKEKKVSRGQKNWLPIDIGSSCDCDADAGREIEGLGRDLDHTSTRSEVG